MSTVRYLTIALLSSLVYHGFWIAILGALAAQGPLPEPLHLSLLYFIPSAAAVAGLLFFVKIEKEGVQGALLWLSALLAAAVVPLLGLQCVGAMACILLGQCL